MRNKLMAAVALGSLAMVAACGGSSNASGGSDGGPLKIGVLINKSGVLASGSADAKVGYEMAAADASARYLDGRKIELVEIEHDGTPAGTAAAATQMIQQRGVKLLTGPNTTAQGLAIGPVITRLGGLWVDHTSQGRDTTGKSCQPSYFRVVLNVNQYAKIAEAYVKDSGIKKWAYIGSDYAFGQDMAAGVKSAVETAGGEITSSILSPLGSPDFGTAISKLAGDQATGLITALAGSDAATFSKQAVQFDLFQKYQAVVGDGLLTNMPQKDLSAVAPKMATAVEIGTMFSPELDSAEAKAFMATVEKEHPDAMVDVATRSSSSYNAILVLAQAAAKANSDDPKAVTKALAGGEFEFAQGKGTIRAEDHQALLPGLVIKPVQSGSAWSYELVKTYSAEETAAPVDGCSLGS